MAELSHAPSLSESLSDALRAETIDGTVERVTVCTLAPGRVVPLETQQALIVLRLTAAQHRHPDHTPRRTSSSLSFWSQRRPAADSYRMRHMVMGEPQLCSAQVRRSDTVDLDALTDSHAAIPSAIAVGDADAEVDILSRGCARVPRYRDPGRRRTVSE